MVPDPRAPSLFLPGLSFTPPLHPLPLHPSVAPTEPPDRPCLTAPCQGHLPGASRQTPHATLPNDSGWALGRPLARGHFPDGGRITTFNLPKRGVWELRPKGRGGRWGQAFAKWEGGQGRFLVRSLVDVAGSYLVAHRAGLLPTELAGMWGWILLRPHQGRGSPPAPAPTKQRPGWGAIRLRGGC